MEKSLHCQILIKGQLTGEWSDWFDGLCIEDLPDGDGLLHGTLPDQTALYGVIDRLRDLGLVLHSVDCVEMPNELSDEITLEIDAIMTNEGNDEVERVNEDDVEDKVIA